MKLILMGPPGSGKGTVAKQLVKDFNFTQISPGEMLREEVKKETSLGKEIKKYIEQGELVPDQFVVEMIKLEIKDKDHYILDGFPRSLDQAQEIEEFDVDLVIYLEVPEDLVIKRLSGRRLDPVTGQGYHLEFIPPPDEIKDRLITRKDDQPEVIKERFRVYHQNTEPVIKFYQDKNILKTVDGAPPPDQVYQAVKKIIAPLV